ncbi:hypothetical protein MNB_SV-6-1781 [hydrothermal vent metagenome]|uniref:Uncharacterized protein n=1 Tax=hydrothermal vent metagenome TaxID=652676 RepID=A0A1W1B9F3_9ZZZZ
MKISENWKEIATKIATVVAIVALEELLRDSDDKNHCR